MRFPLAFVALVAVAGCSLFDGEPAQVCVSLTLPASVPAAVEGSVTVDGREVALTSQPTTGDRLLYAESLAAGPGSTPIACTLRNGTAVTRGEVEVDLTSGWRYTVMCSVERTDPLTRCFGCSGSAAFALDPALGVPAGDSLFVVWAGQDHNNPVLF